MANTTNKKYIYAVHVGGLTKGEGNTIEDCRRLEQTILGNKVFGHIGKPNSAAFPSSVVNRGNKINLAFEEETKEYASFFFYATDTYDLKPVLDSLLIQPTSEEALYRIQNNERKPGDAYGDNKTTLTVLRLPEEVFQTASEIGMLQLREGTYYNPDGEMSVVDECCMSDRLLKKVAKPQFVVAHGKLNDIMNSVELFGDLAGYNDRFNTELDHYTPDYVKAPDINMLPFRDSIEADLSVGNLSDEDLSYMNSKKAQLLDYIRTIENDPSYSAEDKAMLISATRETLASLDGNIESDSQETSMEDSTDDMEY